MAVRRRRASPPRQDPCPERVALEHAIRRWTAECENAQRLSHRENGLLTVLSAILGLGLFRIGDFPGMPTGWGTAIKCTLSTAVALVLWALYKTFLVPRSRSPDDDAEIYASAHLAWPHKPELHPSRLGSEEEAVRIAFARTAKAAASLHRRNVRRRESLEQGQRFLVGAIVLGAMAAVALMHCLEDQQETAVLGVEKSTQDSLKAVPSGASGEPR